MAMARVTIPLELKSLFHILSFYFQTALRPNWGCLLLILLGFILAAQGPFEGYNSFSQRLAQGGEFLGPKDKKRDPQDDHHFR
jgi:hypothetical protein